MAQRERVRVRKREPHIVELQPTAARRMSAGAVGDLPGRVEDLGDPVGRRHRLLSHRQQEAQRGDRPDQRQHHCDERDQRAHGDLAVPGGIRAEPEHHDQREVGNHLEQRPELRRHRDFLNLGVVQRACLGVEAVVHVVLAAEGLHRAQPQRRLLDVRGDMARLVLGLPGQLGEGALEVQHYQGDRHDRDQHHDTERPVHRQQDDRDDGDLQDVEDEEHQAERQQPPNHAEVVHDSRQKLARLPAAVKRHRQDLQPGVEVFADVRLDTHGGPGYQPAADEPQHRLGDAHRHRRGADHPQPRWSWWRTGPSITALVISGIATVAARLLIAITSIAIHRARYGSRYGNNRNRSEAARPDVRGAAMAGSDTTSEVTSSTPPFPSSPTLLNLCVQSDMTPLHSMIPRECNRLSDEILNARTSTTIEVKPFRRRSPCRVGLPLIRASIRQDSAHGQ